LAFSVDPYGRGIMQRQPNKNKNILPKEKLFLIGYLGTIGTVIGLHLFKGTGGNIGEAASALSQTMIFNFIVMYELLLVFFIRKQYGIKQLTNTWLWFGVLLSLFLQFVIMYTPLSNIFKVVALGINDYITLVFAGGLFYIGYLIYYYGHLARKEIRAKFIAEQ